jgi:hypothetical protein
LVDTTKAAMATLREANGISNDGLAALADEIVTRRTFGAPPLKGETPDVLEVLESGWGGGCL